MTNRLWISCLLPVLFALVAVDATHKCVWVTGILRCNRNEKAQMNVEVRGYDKDGFGPFAMVDPDDLMGITFTDEHGRFQLDGCADDVRDHLKSLN